MKKSISKIITLLTVFGFIQAGIFGIGNTNAYFIDEEVSQGNNYSAGILDFSIPSAPDFFPEVTLTAATSRNISLINNGILGFDYEVEATSTVGVLCDHLDLEAKLNGTTTYDGILTDFDYNVGGFATTTRDWQFTATLTSNDPSLQNQTCTFDFVFNGTQIGGAGFYDKETITNLVTTGIWEDVWIQTTQGDFEAGSGTNINTSSSPGDTVLAITGSDSTNLSLGASISYSSQDSSHVATHAIDGDNTTYWKSTGNQIPPGWLTVDLGSAKVINKITLLFDHPQEPKDYQLQVSTDNINFTTVATVINNPGSGPFTYNFSSVSARYIRLYITAGNTGQGQVSVAEFQVYPAASYSISSGTLESQVFDAGAIKRWKQLSWSEILPSGTDITLEVVTSNDGTTWSSWMLTSSNSPIDLMSLPETTHIKWRATLTTTDPAQTPVLQEVRITYLPGTASEHIVLNEFLPNPSGTNPDYGYDFGEDNDLMPKGEWVEIYNKAGGSAVDLAGWYIKDKEDNVKYITSADTNTGSTIINSGDWLVVYMNEAILNNDADIVYLYDSLNNLIDSYSYDLATYCTLEPTPDGANTEIGSNSCPLEIPGNKSYARIPDGTGTWQDPIPTPGTPNKLDDEDEIEELEPELLLEEIIEEIPLITTTTTTSTIPDPEATTTTTTPEPTTATTIPDLETTTTTTTTITILDNTSVTTSTTTTTTTIVPVTSGGGSVATTTTAEPPVEETTTTTEPPMDEVMIIEEAPIIEEQTEESNTQVSEENLVNEENSTNNETLVIESQPVIKEEPVAVLDNNSSENESVVSNNTVSTNEVVDVVSNDGAVSSVDNNDSVSIGDSGDSLGE